MYKRQDGTDGATGPAGPTGPGGGGVRVYYRRTTSSTAPPPPTGITYNGVAFSDPDPWAPLQIPGSGGDYIWQVDVAYIAGRNGSAVVTGVVRYNAVNGISIVEIYQRGTAVPTAPSLTYDGSAFGGLGLWSRTIPATPSNQNLYAMTATYREDISCLLYTSPSPRD